MSLSVKVLLPDGYTLHQIFDRQEFSYAPYKSTFIVNVDAVRAGTD
ncbi:MAG: hypothetical protein ABI210_11775 [Abditibacteriaceae bacterium]